MIGFKYLVVLGISKFYFGDVLGIIFGQVYGVGIVFKYGVRVDIVSFYD